jgi:hypothetical protein
MQKWIWAAAGAALLIGCTDRGADKDGDGKITDEEVASEISSVKLEPGQWENVVEFVDIKIDGTPAGVPADMLKSMTESMKGRKQTSKSCITAEQAENPGAEFFAAQEKTQCDVKKFTMTGGDIDAQMSCKNIDAPGVMNMTMQGQYGPSSYDMTMNMNSDVQGMKFIISAKSSGSRIGACPEG